MAQSGDKQEEKKKEILAGVSDDHFVTNVPIPSELSWSGNMADNWGFFKPKFVIYLLASGNFENDLDRSSYPKVIEKFDEHFNTEKNVTYERYKFFTRNQNSGESYEDYLYYRVEKFECYNDDFDTLTESLIKDVAPSQPAPPSDLQSTTTTQPYRTRYGRDVRAPDYFRY